MFEEFLWFYKDEENLVRGILVADSLEEAKIFVPEEGKVAMTGRLQYAKGKERGNAMRVLWFVPDNGTSPLIVQIDMLSAPGRSKV